MISIIIPVYNADQWLRRCIESCINQTYKDIEIILVDDGSSDTCPQICDEYEKKDKRVVVFHKSNGGVSSSRNMGISKAKGDYIFFVDSDDWLEKNALEIILKYQVKADYDLVVCNHIVHYDDLSTKLNILDEKTIIFEEEYAEYLLKTVSFLRTPWGKLYKANIVKTHNVLFDRNMTLGEDTLFNYSYSKYVKSIRILSNDYLYNYQEITSNEKNRRYYKSVGYICESRNKMIEGYLEIFRFKRLLKKNLIKLSNNVIHSFSVLENILVLSKGTYSEIQKYNHLFRMHYKKFIVSANPSSLSIRDKMTLVCYKYSKFRILFFVYYLYRMTKK